MRVFKNGDCVRKFCRAFVAFCDGTMEAFDEFEERNDLGSVPNFVGEGETGDFNAGFTLKGVGFSVCDGDENEGDGESDGDADDDDDGEDDVEMFVVG